MKQGAKGWHGVEGGGARRMQPLIGVLRIMKSVNESASPFPAMQRHAPTTTKHASLV